MCAFMVGCSQPYKIAYLNQPELIPHKNFDFKLDAPFMIQVNTRIYTVPKGFITDLASTPRLLWPLYAPNDTRTIRPAILHDYMYRCDTNTTRLEADAIFYYALLNQGVGKWTARKYYWGVRLFGFSSYTNNQC